ncbi:hypothetical protein ABZ910_35210, partial [Streptomyces sp. NPDC046805]
MADLNCSDPYDMSPLGELPIRPPGRGHESADRNGHENGTRTEKGGRHLPGPRPCRLLVLATANKPGPLRRAVEAHALGYVN